MMLTVLLFASIFLFWFKIFMRLTTVEANRLFRDLEWVSRIYRDKLRACRSSKDNLEAQLWRISHPLLFTSPLFNYDMTDPKLREFALDGMSFAQFSKYIVGLQKQTNTQFPLSPEQALRLRIIAPNKIHRELIAQENLYANYPVDLHRDEALKPKVDFYKLNTALYELLCKSFELQAGHHKQAVIDADIIYSIIDGAKIAYLFNKISFNQFKNEAIAAISYHRGELDKQRGFKKVLVAIIAVLNYMIASVGSDFKFFGPQTDSHQKLDNILESIRQCEAPALQK